MAGARIDFNDLKADCIRPYSAFDMSFFLTCRALELPRNFYALRKETVPLPSP